MLLVAAPVIHAVPHRPVLDVLQFPLCGGDTTVNVLTMAENTLGGALLFFHDMESDGVCSTDFHDCEVQVYVEKVENSVRGLSRSVKRGAYCISRNM